MLTKSYIYAPIFLALLFTICLLVVLGLKVLLAPFLSRFKKSKAVEAQVENVAKKRTQRKPIRSIEINPEDVDRIYVRKTQ